MAYEEMKATKTSSKADAAKNALSYALDSITKSKSSAKRKPRKSSTSSKSTSTKNTSTLKSTSAKSTTNSKKTSTTSKTNSTKKSISSTTKKQTQISEPIININTQSKDKPSTTNSNQKSKNSNSKKTYKKLTYILVSLFLIIGVIGGFFTSKFLCANDVYEMNTFSNGEIDITIGVNETTTEYVELGVKCIAFGKDYSDNCNVKYYFRNKLTEDATQVLRVGEKGEGIYYAVYETPANKYKSVTLIRNIIVLRGEDDA